MDDGLVAWDERLLDILPDFRMWDQYATQNLTIRDLLTHRSGMPRHDFMWYTSNTSRSEILKRIRYLEPSYEIRERYQYNNLMYLTAACAMEEVAGESWEEMIQKRILGPLGMKNTHFTIEEMMAAENYASPHIEKNDKLKRIPLRNAGPVAPAGTLNSNVVDLCNWVKLHLDDGNFNNQQLISPATLQEIHAAQVIIPGSPEISVGLLHSYAIGWNVGSYRGRYLLAHDGGIDGFTTLTGFLPNEGIGFIILINKNLCPLPRYLAFEMIDRVLEIPHDDWIKEGLETYQRGKSAANEARMQNDLLRKKGTKPSHSLEEYTGEYEHPGYGKVTIELVDGRLRATFNAITCLLDHWHYDVFAIAEESQDLIVSIEGMKFTFRTNINGDIDDLTVPFEPSTDDIVFKKLASTQDKSIEKLLPYVGFYEIYGYTVEVALKGNDLYAIVPGQPVYELIPIGNHQFVVKMMTGYNIRFEMDENNRVKEVVLVAPYGAFSAKPKK